MFKRRWLNKDKAIFLQRLGRFLNQGYPFIVAIEMLSYQESPRGQSDIRIMLEYLKKGEAMHYVLKLLRFPSDVCGFIFFAEHHGDLSSGLIESGLLLQRREQSKRQLQQVLKYPIFLLWLVFLVTYIMMRYLYPQFQTLYRAMDIKLPWITRFFLFLNHYTTSLFFPLFFLFILFLFILYRFVKHTSPHKLLSFLVKIPILSKLIRIYMTYYLSIQLGSLLKVGMSVYTAFQVISEQTFMGFYQSEGKRVITLLKQGESLEKAFIHQPHYIKEFSYIIAHGQLNGLLGQELLDYSEMLLADLEAHIKRSIGIMQPILLSIVGGFTLLLFLSVLLPIFQMMNGF